MSFSYTGDLTIPLNYVRFRLDDKLEEYAEYSDEELNYFIDKITGTPTENDLNKIVLRLLKQQLNEILRSPSRERAGAYEVYAASAGSLRLAITELENELRDARLVSPSFGGVYKCETKQNRRNQAYTDTKFHDGRLYRNNPLSDDSFIHED